MSYLCANIIILLCPIIIVFVIIYVLKDVRHFREIVESGFEVEAEVTRVEIKPHERRWGTYYNYVTYMGDDGYQHESITDVDIKLKLNSKVKIKYLPGDYKSVVITSLGENDRKRD